MTARFWRVIGLRADGADLALTQAALWGSSGAIPSVLTASHSPVEGGVGTLMDGVLEHVTRWSRTQAGAPGFALVWDAGTAVNARNVRFGGAERHQWARAFTLQSSADSIVWDTIGTFGTDWPGEGVLAPLPASDDQFAGLVVSQLMFEESLIDSAGAVWTASGGAALVSGGGVGGGGALSLNGASNCFISTPSSNRVAFGAQDFCVELYVLWDGQGAEQALVCMRDASLSVWDNVLRLVGGVVQWSNGVAWLGGGTPVPSGQLVHIALSREGSRLRIFVAGAKVFEGTDSTNIAGNRPCYVGAYDDFRGNSQLAGLVDFLRITKGAARYTEDFEPPASIGGMSLDFGVIGIDSPLTLGAVQGDQSGLLSSELGCFARDAEFGGAGRIWGTTMSKGTLTNVPIKARVVLFHQRSKLMVRETWSDPATGAFEFIWIDTRQDFLVLAEDAAGSFRPVAASRLVPEIAP